MKIKIKKLHSDAVIPFYAKRGDAGMDLTCTAIENDEHDNIVCHTGLALEIPEGYVGLIFPRSSVSKYDMHLRNGVGVIDSGYRGELMLKFGHAGTSNTYKVGDKVGQLMILPYPEVTFKEVKFLSETDRGEGGFGSTTVNDETATL